MKHEGGIFISLIMYNYCLSFNEKYKFLIGQNQIDILVFSFDFINFNVDLNFRILLAFHTLSIIF